MPAYNEANVLRHNVGLIEKSISQITDSYEIIITEDGCSDETAKVATALSNGCSNVVHIHSDHRLGKGLAIKRALNTSKGRAVIFMDADLSTNLSQLYDVLELLDNGYDAVIGSRYVKGSYVSRSLLRYIASRAYNLLVKLLFWDNVLDHQCGFKGFSRRALKSVIEGITENGFLFDTELIVKMTRKELRKIEIPVKWTEPEDRISKFNLLVDGIEMGLALVKLRLKLWAYGRPKSA